MFVQLGQMFAWATPEHLLDYMSIEEVFYYYDTGLMFEDFKAKLLIANIADALRDKKTQPPRKSDKPDKAKFYQHYGDQIERG